ncbi:MAG: SDR family oxidoreductase [Rhodobiaceae bacterium]|nr:SDR family oxidoreductase [Rhodobiaceae bacterium]MCC0057101.1 SDR family oxidoreductase [Rhodobiaceae bacterium]
MTQRVALVTGAGRGLGRVMALALLAEGHKVILSSTNQQTLDDVASESGAGTDRVATIICDLTTDDGAERLAADASSIFGPIDIFLSNAGIGIDALRRNYMENPFNFWEIDREKLNLFFSVNATSPIMIAARLAPSMIEKGWGRIVSNTTSLDTMLRMPLYGGSKAAMEAEVSVMAHNLAGTGVTANVLIPGGATVSRMTERIGIKVEDMFPDTIMEGPIRFLASDLSDDFTGRRILANRWPAGMDLVEASVVASDPIAWTGFGAAGVHPSSTRGIFRRDSGVGE